MCSKVCISSCSSLVLYPWIHFWTLSVVILPDISLISNSAKSTWLLIFLTIFVLLSSDQIWRPRRSCWNAFRIFFFSLSLVFSKVSLYFQMMLSIALLHVDIKRMQTSAFSCVVLKRSFHSGFLSIHKISLIKCVF